MDTAIPPEYHPLLAALVAEPNDVSATWRYGIVLMMIDRQQAQVVQSDLQADKLFLTLETPSGERFGIVRPPMKEETEQHLLEQVRELVAVSA